MAHLQLESAKPVSGNPVPGPAHLQDSKNCGTD